MIEPNNNSFNEVLDNLKNLSNSFVVDVTIPSLNQIVQFKELNTKQQKKLLETITDTSIYKTDFSKIFLQVIKENIVTENININKLTIYDKILIGLFLRSKISDTLNVIFDENSPVYSENIELNPIIEKSKGYIHPSTEEICILKNNSEIKVELSVPTIELESKYESEISKNSKKIENVKNINEIGNVLSEAFISEVSKYINKITFDDQLIDLNVLTINQRIKICEILTADLTQKILQKISEWKKDIDYVLTVASKDNTYNKVVSLDNLLFLM
jgi:hypothetical protein